MLDRWSKVLVRRPLVVLLAGVALTLAAGAYGAGVFGSLSQGGFDDPGSESSQALQLERDALGNHGADVDRDLLQRRAPGRRPRVPGAGRGDARRASRRAPPPRCVTVVRHGARPTWSASDGHGTQVVISLAGETQDEYLESFEAIEHDLAGRRACETDLAGTFAIFADVNERTEQDLQRAETISLPVVAILAILIFGSLVAAAMPVLVGGGGRRRRARRGPAADRCHRRLDLLDQRDHAARDGPGDRLRPLRRQPLPRGAGAPSRRRPGRRRRRPDHDHAHRRPDRALLRPHRRRGDVVAAGLPAVLPPVHGVRRDRGRAGRDAGRADRPAGDAAAARPPDRQGPRPRAAAGEADPGARCLGPDRRAA